MKRLLAQPVQCQTCGTMFRPWKKAGRYCSRTCYLRSIKRLVPRRCEQCGKDFQPTNFRDRFCDKFCSTKWIAIHRSSAKGWTISSKGYKLILKPDHPNASTSGYVMEHRLTMERQLKRFLLRSEVVHHKNGNRLDNRPENLEVMEKRAHDAAKKPVYHATCPYCLKTFPIRGNAHTVDHGWKGQLPLRLRP